MEIDLGFREEADAVIAPPSISVDDDNRGAYVKTLHTKREVKIYGLLETELENLTCIGREQRLWSTIGAASFAFLLGCIWDMSNTPQGTTIPKTSWILISLFILVTLFSIFKACQYWLRQKSALADLVPDRSRTFMEKVQDKILTWVPEKKAD